MFDTLLQRLVVASPPARGPRRRGARHTGAAAGLALLLAFSSLAGCQRLAPIHPPVEAEPVSYTAASPAEVKAGLRRLLPNHTFPEPPDDPEALAALNAPPTIAEAYLIAPADEIEISVYNAVGLEKRQSVRPDGRIDFPLVGEFEVAGKTPAEVRQALRTALAVSIDDPEVTITIAGFDGRNFSVAGAVGEPGVFEAERTTRLLEAIALAGGLERNADLRGAALVRDGEVLPVSLHRLLKERDLRHNVVIWPGDSLYVPDVTARRALVLGEVNRPMVVTLDNEITVLEAIARAQGFTRDASSRSVTLIRGSLEHPELISVDPEGFLRGGATSAPRQLAGTTTLEPGDIVYVSKTLWASFADFLRDIGLSTQLNFIITTPTPDVGGAIEATR